MCTEAYEHEASLVLIFKTKYLLLFYMDYLFILWGKEAAPLCLSVSV